MGVNKVNLFNNLVERCIYRSVRNENFMVESEMEKLKTVTNESEEVQEAMSLLLSSYCFPTNYSNEEKQNAEKILTIAGYLENKGMNRIEKVNNPREVKTKKLNNEEYSVMIDGNMIGKLWKGFNKCWQGYDLNNNQVTHYEPTKKKALEKLINKLCF